MNAKLLSLLALASFAFAQGPSGTTGTSDGTSGTNTFAVTETGTAAIPSGTGIPPNENNLPPCIRNCIPTAAQQANCNAYGYFLRANLEKCY